MTGFMSYFGNTLSKSFHKYAHIDSSSSISGVIALRGQHASNRQIERGVISDHVNEMLTKAKGHQIYLFLQIIRFSDRGSTCNSEVISPCTPRTDEISFLLDDHI